MHPIDPFLKFPLSECEGLWVGVQFTRCDKHGCVAATYVPIRLALRDGRASPE